MQDIKPKARQTEQEQREACRLHGAFRFSSCLGFSKHKGECLE